MNPWLCLLLAGVFEVGFTTSMMLSEGFSKLKYIALFLVCAIFSFVFLSQSLKGIPLGTAYAVWTGVGAFGTVIVGIVFFKEPVSFYRLLFLALLVGSIIGLKVTAGTSSH